MGLTSIVASPTVVAKPCFLLLSAGYTAYSLPWLSCNPPMEKPSSVLHWWNTLGTKEFSVPLPEAATSSSYQCRNLGMVTSLNGSWPFPGFISKQGKVHSLLFIVAQLCTGLEGQRSFLSLPQWHMAFALYQKYQGSGHNRKNLNVKSLLQYQLWKLSKDSSRSPSSLPLPLLLNPTLIFGRNVPCTNLEHPTCLVSACTHLLILSSVTSHLKCLIIIYLFLWC
jgi:hypothetical protein